MKQFAVELTRTVYITIHVEAQDEDEAETLAWKQIENGDYKDAGHWEISDISEC